MIIRITHFHNLSLLLLLKFSIAGVQRTALVVHQTSTPMPSICQPIPGEPCIHIFTHSIIQLTYPAYQICKLVNFWTTGINQISSVIGSPSNSSSTSYYTNTPNHQIVSSVSSNYDGQSPISAQPTTNSRRPNRNHNTSTARSTPNLPTSTPIHNVQSPIFSTQSNQPSMQPQQYCQAKQQFINQSSITSAMSSPSHTSSSSYYHPPINNFATNQSQSHFSTTTVSSTSTASVAAGRDAFTGSSSRQMSPSSPPPAYNNQNSTSQLDRIEEKLSGRGITRSSASYGIQKLLQEQVT